MQSKIKFYYLLLTTIILLCILPFGILACFLYWYNPWVILSVVGFTLGTSWFVRDTWIEWRGAYRSHILRIEQDRIIFPGYRFDIKTNKLKLFSLDESILNLNKLKSVKVNSPDFSKRIDVKEAEKNQYHEVLNAPVSIIVEDIDGHQFYMEVDKDNEIKKVLDHLRSYLHKNDTT